MFLDGALSWNTSLGASPVLSGCCPGTPHPGACAVRLAVLGPKNCVSSIACAYCSKHSSRPGMLSISTTFRSGRRRAITYLLTPYNHHRHTTVSSSASHRTLHPTRLSTHAPVSGTDFDDRAAPARPSSECLSVGYGPVSLMAMLPVPPALHLTLTSYLLTRLRLLWFGGGVCRGQGAGGGLGCLDEPSSRGWL